MEKAMAPHSSTLAWKIPWTEEPGALQSVGSLRVGHDWVTSLSLLTFMHWRRKWQPAPVFLPGESSWASVYGVTQSRTRLKRLSSSSSITHLFLLISSRQRRALFSYDPTIFCLLHSHYSSFTLYNYYFTLYFDYLIACISGCTYAGFWE